MSKSPRKEDRDEQLVEVWTRRLREAWTEKSDFTAAAAEVDAYFKGSVDPFFESEACREWLNFEHMPKVTVNTAFQIRGWLAPNLYQRNPTRTVTSRTKDSILSALGAVLGAYLNYTPHETGLAAECRFAVDESLLSGRSCVYTGWREAFGLVTSWFVSIDDVVIDPTARRPRDAYWIAIRRRLPRWELEKEYEAAEKLEDDLPRDTIADGVASDSKITDEIKPSERLEDEDESSEDMVTFYEIYSRMGVGWRGADLPEGMGTPDDSINYRKIVLVDGHSTPLYVGRWESPLYVDEVWPLTFLDLTPTKNCLWPVSLMKAALPSQRAVNLLASIALEKAKQHAREVYGIREGAFEENDRERIANGGMSELVSVKGDPGLSLQQLVQRWEGGQISPEIMQQLNFHLGQIGEVTGLLPILKGQSSEQQIRSATEADIKDRNARSRLQDLSEVVEDWSTRVARNEGILARTELNAKEISKILDTMQGLDLGYRVVASSLGVPLPTRLYAPGTEVDPKKEEPCLQGLMPMVARYFPTEQEAQAAAVYFSQNFPAAANDYFLRTGKPAFVDKVEVKRVTVEDVWTDTAYLSSKDLAREIAFRVESGSTKRPDANKAIDQANTLMSTVGQPALQMGDVATYNAALSAMYETLQFPPNMRLQLQPPPAPMAPGGGPQLQPGSPPPKQQGGGP